MTSKGFHVPPASTRPSTAGPTTRRCQLIRESGSGNGAGGLGDRLPPADQSPFVRDRAFLDDGYFRWGVSVDDLGLAQMRELFADAARMPRLTWWANVVTDAGHHGAGPRSAMARDSLAQSDARLGVFLDHLEALGVAGRRGLPAHGRPRVRAADPTVTGSWRPALEALGVAVPRRGSGLRLLPLTGPPVASSADRVHNSPRGGYFPTYRIFRRDRSPLRRSRRREGGRRVAVMKASLHIAQDAAADQVLSTDAFALLVGMLLDQQFPMERAFAGPAKILERFGTLDPGTIADADPEAFATLCATPPASTATAADGRPGPGGRRAVVADYDGDAERLWTERRPARTCSSRSELQFHSKGQILAPHCVAAAQ